MHDVTASTGAHIGIVACSAEGAALCYRTVCELASQRLGGHLHPEVSMHTHSLGEYVRFLESGDVDGVAGLMADSADKLTSIGAELLICPDNTIHSAMKLVVPKTRAPWLHIAEVVAGEAGRRGFRKVGILGTRWLVASDVYPEKLRDRGLEWLRPNDADRDEVSRIIMDELVHGRFESESIERLRTVIARLQSQGCDSVVLGCTELPLVIDENNSPLPPLDSTRLLAAAALDVVLRA